MLSARQRRRQGVLLDAGDHWTIGEGLQFDGVDLEHDIRQAVEGLNRGFGGGSHRERFEQSATGVGDFLSLVPALGLRPQAPLGREGHVKLDDHTDFAVVLCLRSRAGSSEGRREGTVWPSDA